MYVYSDGINRASFKPLMNVCRVHLFITNQPSGPFSLHLSFSSEKMEEFSFSEEEI